MYYDRKLNRNNSPSSDRINLKHISSESPLRDASNGGIFMRLGSIDKEIIRNFQKQFFTNNSPSNDAKRMKIPPFDASRHGDSNDMCSIFLRSVDMEYDQNFKLQKSKIIYTYSALQEVTGHYLQHKPPMPK